MRRIFLTIIFSLTYYLVVSQSLNLNWAKQLGGNDGESADCSIIDASGNIYVAGQFKNTGDFDPGSGAYNLTSAGDYDIYITKLNSAGTFVWAKRIGGVDWDYPSSITIDKLGNICVAGGFRQTVDFDPGPGTYTLAGPSFFPYQTSAFILKLDPSGNFIWAKQFESDYRSWVNNITIDNSGNIVTISDCEGNIDFDPGTGVYMLNTGASGSNVFISKLDKNGAFVWVKQFVPNISGSENGIDIETDLNGNIYSSGNFNGSIDFDPNAPLYNLTSQGDQDVYVSKLDSLGNFKWAKQIGGDSTNNAWALALDFEKNVYCGGTFMGNCDFDPGPSLYNITALSYWVQGFVLKLDSNGVFKWAKQIKTKNSSDVFSIATKNKDIYCVGTFQDTTDFDTGTGVNNLFAGYADPYILKLDSLGNSIWAKQLKSSSYSQGLGVFIDNSDNIYFTGGFSDTVDFNPEVGVFKLISNGIKDAFVAKYSQTLSGIQEILQSTNFKIYPNPNSGSFKVETNEIQNGEIIILNSLGQIIHQQKMVGSEHLVKSTGLAKGLYYYIITENKIEIGSGKIAIE